MHLTPEILYNLAKNFTDERVKKERAILAAYLRGSLLYGSLCWEGQVI